MRNLTKNMLLVGPIVLAFIVALVTPSNTGVFYEVGIDSGTNCF